MLIEIHQRPIKMPVTHIYGQLDTLKRSAFRCLLKSTENVNIIWPDFDSAEVQFVQKASNLMLHILELHSPVNV